ncbi:unnamed protein product [Boreogadus saida]
MPVSQHQRQWMLSMTTLSIGARKSLPKVASPTAMCWFISACHAALCLFRAHRAHRRQPTTKRSCARGGREAPEAQHPKGPILPSSVTMETCC